jgi:hypothetical protein
MTVFILGLFTAFVLLSANQQTSRVKLLLVQISIVLGLMITGLIIEASTQNPEANLTDITINGAALTYNATQWIFYSMIAFGIVTLFFERKEVPNQKVEPKPKDHSEESSNNVNTNLEADTQAVSPSGNVSKIVSSDEDDSEKNSSLLGSVKKSSPHKNEDNGLNSTEEILNIADEKKYDFTDGEKETNVDFVISSKSKWFDKKIFTFSLNQTQKIICGISTFLIVLVLAYAIAEEIDSDLQISNTWGIWIIFILIQAWFQNKLWNSNDSLNFALLFPNVSHLFNSIKPSSNSRNIKPVTERPTQHIKKKHDITILLIYALTALMVIMIIAVVIKKNKSTQHNSISTLKSEGEQPQTNEVNENSEATITIVNTPITFENETVSNLLKELENGQVKTYEFNDPSSLGFKFKSTFPESLKFFIKKTKECKAGTEIIDAHGNTLRYTIVLNEGAIPNLTSSQLDKVLDATLNTQIKEIYKSNFKSYEIINSGTKMFIGNYKAICSDLLLDNIAGSDIKYSAVRSYNFYFAGGTGQLSFWLHNNNRSQLKKDFLEYEALFQEIANRSTLNKEQ